MTRRDNEIGQPRLAVAHAATLWTLGAILVMSCSGDPLIDQPETGTLDADVDHEAAADGDADGDGDGDGDGDIDADSDADGDGDGDTDADADTDADSDDDLLCPANGNGILERAEAMVSFDESLLFRTQPLGEEVSVDLAGVLEDGVRTWHFEEEVEGERVVEEQAWPIEGTWFEDDFPTATHFAPLSEEYGYDGVYRLDDDALYLLGFVSADDEDTRVTYDPPVPLLRFPLEEGDRWEVTTVGSGWYSMTLWIPFYDTETYTFTADAFGDVVVPAGRFPVLRVRSELTQTVGLVVTRRIAYSFMAECWGRVAQVASRDNESELQFDVAADYRRLAFE